MKKITLLSVLMLLSIITVMAQYPKEFPNDNAGYGKAYAEFIKTCTRDDCKEVAEKFPRPLCLENLPNISLK